MEISNTFTADSTRFARPAIFAGLYLIISEGFQNIFEYISPFYKIMYSVFFVIVKEISFVIPLLIFLWHLVFDITSLHNCSSISRWAYSYFLW